jgi:hypothetical protein
MKNENLITCPKCGYPIDVNEVLYHDLEDRIKKEYFEKSAVKEKEFESKFLELKNEKDKIFSEKESIKREKENLKEAVDKEVQAKLKFEKSNIEKNIRSQIDNEKSDEIMSLQKELHTKSLQVRELNLKSAEIEKLKREKDELRETIALEKERELTERLKEERLKIQKNVDEDSALKLKEREKVIDDLKNQLNEAKRKAEQGSMQLQGEIQEIELENLLRTSYPIDDISEIKKGQRGADVLQTVRNQNGITCGKIYYESKRTKNFDNNWLQKLRDDNLEVKADVLVLVTEAMPDGNEKYFYRDGVWICSLLEVKGLSFVLRFGLIQIQSVAVTQQGRETKMEMLYNYLTSQEFKGQFEAILEGFKSLQDSYSDEKLKMQKIWKEREKQLEKILANAVNFYGSLRGIAGSSIPEIKMLEN